jgi:hypothetical protein
MCLTIKFEFYVKKSMFGLVRQLVSLADGDVKAFQAQIEKFEAEKRKKLKNDWLGNCTFRGEDSGGGCGKVAPDHPFLPDGTLRDECTLEFAPYLGVNCFPSVSGPE